MWAGSSKNRLLVCVCVVSALAISSYFVIDGCLLLLRTPADTLRMEAMSRAEARTHSDGPEYRNAEALGRAILRRNIFDSQTGPLRWGSSPSPRASASAARAAEMNRDEHVMPCDANMELVGHVLNEAQPESSRAIVRTPSETKVLRLGDELLASRFVALTPTYAFFTNPSGESCSLYLFAKSSRRPRATAVAKKVAKGRPEPKKPALSNEDYESGLTRIAEGKYRIKSSFLSKVLGERASLMRGLRFIPQPRRGHPRGMRVYGIRKGTLLHRLGLRNGDILRTLNGFPLASANGVLEAYGQLKNRDQLDIAYLKRGKPRHLNLLVE